MKLVFLGGVQGVGKTTLIKSLTEKFGDKIKVINPGELFRRYFYRKKTKTPEEIEAAKKIVEGMPKFEKAGGIMHPDLKKEIIETSQE